MLAYPIDEAEALLGSKLSTAEKSLANCEEDLGFLREQITVRLRTISLFLYSTRANSCQTMEVAVARVYNWEVVQKRKDKSDTEKVGEKAKDAEGQPNG